ncbi:MAG: hypothetical protein OEZ01_07620, partial [Candidatus Heimdallarchaeota archaeon]|nr:hypothetical protein [Candidatus Heimdallarchaeota archaeon]
MKDKINNPFFLMSFFYLFVATLISIQASLIAFGWISSGSTSISWVRIHFITLGVVTQFIFGYTPIHLSKKPLSTRWDIFLVLNSGIIIFFYGRSILDFYLIATGGTLIFMANILFLIQIIKLDKIERTYSTTNFYIFGILFYLIGIILGAGIWTGLSEYLKIFNILEAHIHAQNWGFLSLMFAGFIIDLYPEFTKNELHIKNNIDKIFISLSLGGFALVLSPWIGGVLAQPIAVFGIVLFLFGTSILLNTLIKTENKDIGIYHLIIGYNWIYTPVLLAPFVLLKIPAFSMVEYLAPQALVYGWIVQLTIALLPFILRNSFTPNQAKLGGNVFSLITVNVGALSLWISIFSSSLRGVFQGIAYLFWFFALMST